MRSTKDNPPFAVGDHVVNEAMQQGRVFVVKAIRFLAWKPLWTMELGVPGLDEIILGNVYVTEDWQKAGD